MAFLRHHLTTGHNVIPLKDLRYATEHQQKGDVLTHVGWKIQAASASENPRTQKHRYEFVFSVEEARAFRVKLDEMLANFDDTTVQAILDGGAALPAADALAEASPDADTPDHTEPPEDA